MAKNKSPVDITPNEDALASISDILGITTKKEEPKLKLDTLAKQVALALPEINNKYLEVESNIAELLRFFRQLRALKSALVAASTAVGELEQSLSRVVIPEKMRSMGAEALTSGGYTYSLGARTFAAIIADNKGQALDWLRANGYKDIILENVNAKTLSTIITAHIEKHGLKPPEDAIKVHQQDYISVRKK